jgi:predicted ATPase/DNA-binding SARP family transcriptional activator
VLTIAVLGTVEAQRDGVRVDIPAGKTTELLARLALDAGMVVRADTLLEDLWSGRTGRNTLQSKVSQLRRALGDRGSVVSSEDGYRLMVDVAAVDASRAIALAAHAAKARRADDPKACLELAGEALALFRGEVLPRVGDWASTRRARLEEVRAELVEDAMAARVELGAGGEVVAELESLVEQYPLREGLWASLVTALYRAGRQADALAAYGRVRRLLVDELGVDPGAGLRALEQQVLQQSPALEAGPPSQPVGAPGNLPVASSTLVGRSEDVAAVVSALDKHRLVTVAGLAGVGKTRLAVEVGRQLEAPGGVWLVRLDAVDASVALGQVVAETLHVPGGEQALPERLAGASAVVLLDNCEHVVESVGVLARSLLEAAPQLRVLATSQVPLGIEDEHLHALEPLTHEDSVALFTRRAREMRRQLLLDDDATAAIAEVCRALDGLPLAIELAASRVRSLSVREIARRLDDRFVLLRDPNSQRPERRRALEGAIAWSYELLFPDDQRGLWALSCFAGDASLDATELVMNALGVPAGSVLDTISRLVDRSLVTLEPAEGGALRYRLLDSIKAYATERLRESGQAGVAGAAHARWYAEAAHWCAERVRSDRQSECLTTARVERANIDVALAWCAAHDPLLGVQIANGFGWTWVVLGDGTAGAGRMRNALTPDTPARERAMALLLAGWLEASAGDVALAQGDLDGARTIAEELADEVMAADVQRHQAFLSIQLGRADVVLASSAASLVTYRRLGLRWQAAGSLLLSAFGAVMRGDTLKASRDGLEALGCFSRIGDSWAMVHAHGLLAAVAQAEQRLDDAAHALAAAADESKAMGFLGQAALHRASLARVQHRLGDPSAPGSYQQAIDDATAGGDGRLAATARLNLARLLRGAARKDAALALLEVNDRWYAAAGGGEYALLSHCLLASERGDAQALEEDLVRARGAGNREVEVCVLDALARLAAEAGDLPVARARLADADGLAPQVAHVLDLADRVDAAVVRRLIRA